jgi:hypothetical protein
MPLGPPEPEVGSCAGSGLVVPFGLSLLDFRACLGELDTSDSRGVDSVRNGDPGRPGDGLGMSRSFDFPLPNPLNAELRLVDDFLSGEDARP